ncbi:hypothetical protein [Geopseudomonas guangdongensis]|uniref:MSHA biogenesis protein MshK n=1 Tax=Geopseudomonas guangdongensis TaxID=1245526 RepID=A0A1H2EIJ6_9GAMM|nr:hypothetical protein [Pseudomonas guangdongensis]SDT94829.1 MSHA biogenesis protein MshK [Pseudomonas guangdongensis]
MLRALGATILGLLLGSPVLAASDPTQPPAGVRLDAASRETVAAAPLLQAILRGPHGHRAVLDGRSLRVGERHGDLRLLAIRSRSVVIERQGQRSELFLSQPILTPRH